jgi:hypothetical protein
MKRIAIGAKPQGSKTQFSPDAWVTDRRPAEAMKRFTIDVPATLHKRIKSQCAMRGLKMADMLRELLEKQFPEEYQHGTGGSDPFAN